MKTGVGGSLSTGMFPTSASSAELTMLDPKSREQHEKWITNFLAEMRESGRSTRSGSGGSSGSGHGHGHTEEMTRKKTAISDLQRHLNQEMPDISDEQRKAFYETASTKIFGLMNQSDVADLKAGIILMCILLDAPVLEKIRPNICPPFANHLRKVVERLNTHDIELFDLIACTIGKIALKSGSSTPNFVEFEIGRAIECITNEGNHLSKRHSAILNLRELAIVTPSYFFSFVMHFFESIFVAISEPKLRDPGISALRAALYVVVERERLASLSVATDSKTAASKTSRIDQQIPKCFEICYDEVLKGFMHEKSPDANNKAHAKDREEKIHASLLILNELFRCSHDSSVILRKSRRLFFIEKQFSESHPFVSHFRRFNQSRTGLPVHQSARF